jgi:hypothetical protein
MLQKDIDPDIVRERYGFIHFSLDVPVVRKTSWCIGSFVFRKQVEMVMRDMWFS